MFWSVWPGLAPFLLSTFPKILLDYIWILWPSSRREQNHFVFRTEVHSDSIRRLSLWRRKRRRRRKTITPGLLISLWAPLAQSVSLQPSLQPSPPSQTQSSSVMPTRALSARVCYARFWKGSHNQLITKATASHCTATIKFYSTNPQRAFAQWYMNSQSDGRDLKKLYTGKYQVMKTRCQSFLGFWFFRLVKPKVYTVVFYTYASVCVQSNG